MATETLTVQPLLPEAELARVARILARYLVGRQPVASGAQTARRAANQGMDFLDFRDYQPGDDMRTIDWRASARGGDLQVRRYCSDVASDWYLCVDSSASMGMDDGTNWLLARRLAATLSYLLLHLGHRVGLLLFSSDIDTACAIGRGYSQYARIVKTLHGNSPRPSGGSSEPAACARVAGLHHPLIIISDFLAADGMLPALAKLLAGRRQLHLFQLNAATDTVLPAGDSLLLEDIETGEVSVCGDPATAYADARLRLARSQQDLCAWAQRFHIPYTLGNDTDNWRALLLRHFIGP